MKAAVVFHPGDMPKYADFAAPQVQNENELQISVKASAVKNLDKMRASGKHYSTQNEAWTAKVVGGDGVGLLEDGTRVYGIGISGMIAEKAIVGKDRIVRLPEHLDNATAAALPNAVMGSAMALRFRGNLQKGETVLINGATGVTGKIAVQLARHYGAKKIIVTGRNQQALEALLPLGADDIISLSQEDAAFVSQIKTVHKQNPIAVVVDYLWGHSAELILSALKGNGGFSNRTRYVTVGGITGDTITLSSSILRGTDIQISGSGLGSWTPEEMKLLISEILPEAFQLAADRKLKIETVTVGLAEIENAWEADIDSGKRLVVLI
ncbi:putative zinc-binding alcohol dehydrogenase [Flavobacterium noncentrifugens]|uniref:NADPH:quinone reductase n=1 Tax=Flavobacterium noncentrifugens TaxID=1128970 RepID=A0A1G8W3L0_9FLAO|nr:zinc-binding alcohol dehydrogenase family protein [Flavobacterium noncentrifugens]GEP50741.1 putative zinc-binding alcohol dehydrogenase [Flavobacterium noncentrifugens]SDJ72315.1 NADPH:quinone reductase [Flavobacterium noncentrifugens]